MALLPAGQSHLSISTTLENVHCTCQDWGLSEDFSLKASIPPPPRLLEYLQAMRDYFLLEAGDTMYDFYTAIFDKVQEKENWQQPSFLNVQLQEAVGQRRPEDSSRYCEFKTRRPPS